MAHFPNMEDTFLDRLRVIQQTRRRKQRLSVFIAALFVPAAVLIVAALSRSR